MEDLLKDKRTCPEETIYQIGKQGSETPPSVLLEVLDDYRERFNVRFGEHVHILDWALHLDETTPHVHERHVFDMKNGKGDEIEPKQEKTLELMRIPLPKPNEPSNRKNNRKITFDGICRDLFIDVCKEHGLSIEEEPIYGGQAYREKNDFIIESQQVEIAQQQQALASLQAQQAQNSQMLLTQAARIRSNAALLEDEETLFAKIAEANYDKAVKVIAEESIKEVQALNIQHLNGLRDRKIDSHKSIFPGSKKLLGEIFDYVIRKLSSLKDRLVEKIVSKLLEPDVRSRLVRRIVPNLTPSLQKQLEAVRAQQPERHGRKIVQHDRDAR